MNIKTIALPLTGKDSIMIKVKRWLRSLLNTPNALPSELFLTEEECEQDVFTWERWERETKKNFPVRWFILKTIPRFYRRKMYNPISNAWYWIRTHTYNKYHLIDIRQPESSSHEYRWGYIDPCEKLLLSSFKVLQEFVEKEKPTSPREHWSEEDINNDLSLSAQQKDYDEVMIIYSYWMVDRTKLVKELDYLRQTWSRLRRSGSDKHGNKLQELSDAEERFNNIEDEMLIRLMKVRRSMWT